MQPNTTAPAPTARGENRKNPELRRLAQSSQTETPIDHGVASAIQLRLGRLPGRGNGLPFRRAVHTTAAAERLHRLDSAKQKNACADY
jgi:hypothetical protein